MKKQLMICALISLSCHGIYAGGNNVPNFNPTQKRQMQMGFGVPINGVTWTWNGTNYVASGGPAPAPAAGPMTQAQMQAAVAADPNGAAAAAQAALQALNLPAASANQSIMNYING